MALYEAQIDYDSLRKSAKNFPLKSAKNRKKALWLVHGFWSKLAQNKWFKILFIQSGTYMGLFAQQNSYNIQKRHKITKTFLPELAKFLKIAIRLVHGALVKIITPEIP